MWVVMKGMFNWSAARFTGSRVMTILLKPETALINHQRTLGFCSLSLIDLPPMLRVLLWTQRLLLLWKASTHVFIFLQHLSLSFKLIQVETSLNFSSDQITNTSVYPVWSPGWSYIMLHSQSTPLRFWIQFRGLWDLLRQFFHSYIMEGHFSPLQFNLSPQGASRDLPWAEVFTGSNRKRLCGRQDVPGLWVKQTFSDTQTSWFTVWRRGLLTYGIEEMLPGRLVVWAWMLSKGEPVVSILISQFKSSFTVRVINHTLSVAVCSRHVCFCFLQLANLLSCVNLT